MKFHYFLFVLVWLGTSPFITQGIDPYHWSGHPVGRANCFDLNPPISSASSSLYRHVSGFHEGITTIYNHTRPPLRWCPCCIRFAGLMLRLIPDFRVGPLNGKYLIKRILSLAGIPVICCVIQHCPILKLRGGPQAFLLRLTLKTSSQAP